MVRRRFGLGVGLALVCLALFGFRNVYIVVPPEGGVILI